MVSSSACRSRRFFSSTSTAVSRNTVSASAMRSSSSRPPAGGKGARRLPPAIASMLSLSAVSRAIRLRPTYSQTIRADERRLSTTTATSTPELKRCTESASAVALAMSSFASPTSRSTASVSARESLAFSSRSRVASAMTPSSAWRASTMLFEPSIRALKSAIRSIRRGRSFSSNSLASASSVNSERRSGKASSGRSAWVGAAAVLRRPSLIAESSICARWCGRKVAISWPSLAVAAPRPCSSRLGSALVRRHSAIFESITRMPGATRRWVAMLVAESCRSSSSLRAAIASRLPISASRAMKLRCTPSTAGSIAVSASG